MRSAFCVSDIRPRALRALNYSPGVERIRRTATTKSVPLRALLSEMGPAYGSVFTRLDCAPEHGVELVSQSDMFSVEPKGRVIRRDSMAQPERHLVRRWQVLIAGAGTLGENELYGRVLLADRRLEGRYVGPDAMVLTFNAPGDDASLFAFAFLSTRVGLDAIRSTSFGTKILRLRKDLLGELPVPSPSAETAKRVADLVRQSVQGRERYASELQAARAVMENLAEMREVLPMCAQRRSRAIIWDNSLPSLSAWNYASTGGALGYLRKRWSGCLGDALQADGAFNGPRFARVDCERPHGIDFLSQRDVFLMRAVPRRIVRPGIPDRLLFVPGNAVLAASHGQLNEGSLFGRVELASFAAHSAGVTQDILRLLLKDEHRLIGYAFLSTRVGLRLLQSTAVGTSIPLMRVDLLKHLPFPDLSDSERRKVERHANAAELSRLEAGRAEAEAIRIVEEEVLPAWLA